MTAVEAAGQRLVAAAKSGIPCAPVRDLIGAADVASAYAVQQRVTDTRLAAGGRIVGRKIGLTSPEVQRQFGVYQPDFGTLFSDAGYASGEPMPLAQLLQPRIEAEVAFVLGCDLDDPAASAAEVLGATKFLLAAIEVVDSRIADWDITIADTVADNASAGMHVLSATRCSPADLQLERVSMVIDQGGEPLSVGTGSMCMGSPAEAVAWLARELAAHGTPLRAGDVVLSGALGPVVPVTKPGSFRARLHGLGHVEAVFAE
jgi:2-keto-4-pentenoate hydratase